MDFRHQYCQSVTNEINKVKEEIDEATGPIKRQF